MSPKKLLYFICRQIAFGTLGAIGRAFPEVGLCAQEAVQHGPSSILRLQVTVYNSSGLRQQGGHPFNFFPKAGRHRVACKHLIGSLWWVAKMEVQ